MHQTLSILRHIIISLLLLHNPLLLCLEHCQRVVSRVDTCLRTLDELQRAFTLGAEVCALWNLCHMLAGHHWVLEELLELLLVLECPFWVVIFRIGNLVRVIVCVHLSCAV
jgi:hypothetical protein